MFAPVKGLLQDSLFHRHRPATEIAHEFIDFPYDVKMRIVAKLSNRPESLRSVLLACKSFGALLDDPQFLELLLRERGMPAIKGCNMPMPRLKALFDQRRFPALGGTSQARRDGKQGRTFSFSDVPCGTYQVVLKTGKILPEGLGIAVCQAGQSPRNLSPHPFRGINLHHYRDRHVLGITAVVENTSHISIDVTLPLWLCFPHFVRSLELYGPLRKGAPAVVDPNWAVDPSCPAFDELDRSQFAALAVGRGPDGSPLCVCTKFLSALGYTEIGYCSHTSGFHYSTESGEALVDKDDACDPYGRHCYLLPNEACFEWVPITAETVGRIQERGVPLSHDHFGNVLCAARVSLPGGSTGMAPDGDGGTIATVLPGKFTMGSSLAQLGVGGSAMTDHPLFELLCYRIVP